MLASREPQLGEVQAVEAEAEAADSSLGRAVLFRANAATKWVVTAAQTGAVVSRRDLVAPYIVIGSILAAFGTKRLKKIINQQRPTGSPFTDPGMPSSHALVATFAATAWALHLRHAPLLSPLVLMGSAALVSWMRVATGYHSWPQVSVGAVLGAGGAAAWMAAGAMLVARNALSPRTAAAVIYTTYIGGSVAFVSQKMRTWSADY